MYYVFYWDEFGFRQTLGQYKKIEEVVGAVSACTAITWSVTSNKWPKGSIVKKYHDGTVHPLWFYNYDMKTGVSREVPADVKTLLDAVS